MKDSLMDGLVEVGFHSRYPKDATSAFAAVAQLLEHGEITIGNLECLLAPSPTGVSRYRGDQMRGDPEYAANLQRCGFTALSVANNHAMQHGKSAFDATVDALQEAGIACLGLRGT